MKRLVLYTLVLLACTKARTSDAPSAGSAPIAPAAGAPAAAAVPDSAKASSPTLDAPDTPTPDRNDDDPGHVDVVLIPGSGVEPRKERPGVALGEQISEITGRPGTPARARRPLVIVKSKTAHDTSSLTPGKMVHEYVRKGQASVQRCFEDLHAKDSSATGLVTLRFAVDVTGALVDAHVDGFNSEVASCVQTAMSTWTFSAPDKRTRFELVLNLVVG